MEIKETLRKNIIETLELISSFEEQIDYQDNVPIAIISNELLCWWFDDHYHPQDQVFKETFSDAELIKLKEFNDFYDINEKKLTTVYDIKEWHTNEIWIAISKKAKYTLRFISKG